MLADSSVSLENHLRAETLFDTGVFKVFTRKIIRNFNSLQKFLFVLDALSHNNTGDF